MKKKLSIVVLALMGAAFCVSSTSCGGKKDKYYYGHKAIDLQKEYDEAKKKGDAEKMTEIEKKQEENTKSLQNCLEAEREAEKNK